MVSLTENELLTRVGPGTPMGDTLRRYWMPALLSWELEADGSPVRVRLLGENLVAFRNTSGTVGMLDEFCAHRRASLFIGRNEEDGLRCVFHGWKYDVHGNCVDMPNELPEFDIKEKIHLRTYPVVEQGGVAWAYLGPKEHQPPPPNFEFTQVPETHRRATKVIEECNWLQGLEGGIDSIHSSFLHRRFAGAGGGITGLRVKSTAGMLEVEPTSYGYRYASVRPLGEEGNFVRTYHYVMPFTQVRAHQIDGRGEPLPRPIVNGHWWVPVDDNNTMVFNWSYSMGAALGPDQNDDEANGPLAVDQKTFRSYRNKDNNWMQDRLVQKYETFTGIVGINTQDRAVQESMGPIVDRSLEHLGQTHRAVIQARKMLLDAIRIVEDGGTPAGADDTYYSVRAIERILPPRVRWQDALMAEMYGATENAPLLRTGA